MKKKRVSYLFFLFFFSFRVVREISILYILILKILAKKITLCLKVVVAKLIL